MTASHSEIKNVRPLRRLAKSPLDRRWATELFANLHTQSGVLPVSKRDYLGLGLLITALFVAGLILMLRRSMWLDEIFSYVIITRPTFAAMWDSATGFIGTVPLYYIVGWVWTKIVGSNETMLRLLAMFCMSGSLTLIYLRLRRHFELIPVFFGVGSAFLISQLVVLHNVEIRFYAIFLFIGCVFFCIFDWLTRAGARSWPRFAACFALTVAWTFEHLFALYYSAAVLAAMIAVHLYRGRGQMRPKIYAAFPLAWLTVAVAWQQPFNVQNHIYATIGFDAAPPAVGSLMIMMGSSVNVVFISMTLLVGTMLLLDFTDKNERLEGRPESVGNGHIGLFAFAVAFLLVPIGAWVMTRLVTPVFAPRYFIPSVIAYAVIFTYLADRLLMPRLQTRTPAKIAIMAVYASIVLLVPILSSIIKQKESLSFAADAEFYPNSPVVMVDLHKFVSRAFLGKGAVQSATWPPVEGIHLILAKHI